MLFKSVFLLFILFTVIEFCSAQCGCTQKGIKISNFNVGDMILSSQDVLKINGFKAADGDKWPDRILRYTFSPSYPDKNKNPIREFLQIYEKELGNCLKFVEEKKGSHATVVLGPGCSANVGYIDGFPLRITLPDPCVNKRNVKHEFTHLLGFMHEHTRPDRDQFLKIVFENVHSNLCNNFYLCTGCKLSTAYDFDSIMQYPSGAFSCNGQDTILKKDGGKIAFNMEVTKLDAKKVRDYYVAIFSVICIQNCFSVLTDSEKNQLLEVHNNYRRAIAYGKIKDQPPAANMLKMKWSSTAAEMAQTLANKCTIDHDDKNARIYGPFKNVGQNIAIFPGTNITKGVDLWFEEFTLFNYNAMTCQKKCGHYTQLVWAKTQEVGCAATICENQSGMTSLVCNYGPAGNEQGADPYETGFSCTSCPKDTKCEDGLCA